MPGSRSTRPTTNSASPTIRNIGRPLAIQSITTKTAKYSSDAPRSFSRNRTASEVAHAIISGPRSFARGSENRPEPAASISRLSARYDARKMTIRTLPNSAGWNESGPIATQSRAPLIVRPSPGTIGSRSRTNPASPIVYV